MTKRFGSRLVQDQSIGDRIFNDFLYFFIALVLFIVACFVSELVGDLIHPILSGVDAGGKQMQIRSNGEHGICLFTGQNFILFRGGRPRHMSVAHFVS